MFLKAFPNPPRQPEVEFEPTVKSALFLMNEQRVLALLEPSPGTATIPYKSFDDITSPPCLVVIALRITWSMFSDSK